MMRRKETKEVVKRILMSLANSPKSINEIATDCSSNWESVKKYLESMRDAGIIQETQDGNKRIFTLVKNNMTRRQDTYFGLPLDSEKEKLIDSLYAKIREVWIKTTGKIPGKIQVQKTLSKINSDCKLKLPIGWYQYGALCVKHYDPYLTYEYHELQESTLLCVQTVITEYSKEATAQSLKLRQYVEENQELYKTKELLMMLLTSCDFSVKYSSKLNTLLYTLLKNVPPTLDKEVDELLNEFVSLVMKLMITLPEDQLRQTRIEVISAFEKVWKLIALHQYRNDLQKFYSKDILDQYIGLDIKFQKLDVLDTLAYLNDSIPIEQEPQDKEYQKMKDLLSSTKYLSLEEKKLRETLIEKMKKEKGDKETQDFVSKQFGL